MPAVTTPSALKTVFSAAIFAMSGLSRTPSSKLSALPFVPTVKISFAVQPLRWASAARQWLRALNSSSSCRVRLHFSAIISADTPWCSSWNGKLARNSGVKFASEPIVTRLIDSTPQPIAISMSPAAIACAAKCTACWPDPQNRFSCTPGTPIGKPAFSAAMRGTHAP